MFRVSIVRLAVSMLLALPAVDTPRAGEDPTLILKQLDVEVVSPEGDPIPGVEIMPWAIHDKSGHRLWNADHYGPPRTVTTDCAGRTHVSYPEFVSGDNKSLSISVQVFHPDYCYRSVDLKTSAQVPNGHGDGPRIELQRGKRIRVRVIDAAGETVTDRIHFRIAGNLPLREMFALQPDDTFLSYPLRDDWNWFRIVRFPETGPTEFSPLMNWHPALEATQKLTVEIRPGIRVVGRLDGQVERPVVEGRVCAFVADWLAQPQRWTWYDWAAIAPDGTFSFESLPPDVDLQLSAICRGYLSASDTDDSLIALQRKLHPERELPRYEELHYPQWYSAQELVSPVEVNMERACSCEITVLDASGKPKAGVGVFFCPNLLLIGGGGTLFARAIRTRDLLLHGPDGWSVPPEFGRRTDANGFAQYESLPTGQWEFELTTGGNLDPKLALDPKSPAAVVVLDPDRPTKLTVRLAEPAPNPPRQFVITATGSRPSGSGRIRGRPRGLR